MSDTVPPGIEARLAHLREQGLDRCDPVRFHFIASLSRRALGSAGEARRVLEDKLAQLLEAYEAQARTTVAQAAARERGAGAAAKQERAGVADLVARLEAGRAAIVQASGGADVAEYFRSLWAGLRVGSELRQAMQNVPENAGPLNSVHLVHQSLQLMQRLAPAYLQHFLSYADALSSMERMNGADLLLGKGAPSRGEAPKKTGKGRSA